MPLKHAIATLFFLVVPAFVGTEEVVDLDMVTRIRQEAFRNSQVMDTLFQLCDVVGPRLTGSPQMKKANEWTREQLESWGLVNAHLEPWGPFGRGWSHERVSVHLLRPSTISLIAYPKAWAPGTDGPRRGVAMPVKIESEADLEQYRGKLAGKVLLLEEPRALKGQERPLLNRFSEKDLDSLESYPIARERPEGPDRETFLKRQRLQKKLRSFLVEEGALATVEPSERDSGVVRVAGGGSRERDENPGVPALVMAVEHYNRLRRYLEKQIEVELEIDVRARFHDEDPMAYNTVAEIPGTDPKGEVVMLGAHLDSWHSGCGATDNASGSAVMMEAVRILKALAVKPKRTIRIALWSGEEQGLRGSRAYVAEHFGSRPEPTDPEEKLLPSSLRKETGPLTLKPEHARLSAYFNVDNGTGKIRGIYLQENAAVRPIFEAWLKPLADLGATTLTMRNTGGTDHLSFDAVGLPGFQFIQDPVEYGTLTHHTNIDVYDHLQKEDLMQASAIVASFVYQAAMRPERIPRKPLPPEKAEPGRPTASR